MNIIYFTKGVRGQACLEAILDRGYQVTAAVAVQKEQGLSEITAKYGIPVIIPEQVNSEGFAQRLKDFDPDLFILSGYNQILRPLIFDIPPLGTINLHGGRLPQYRGAAPINWQIIQGETQGGCAVIYVDEGIDTGDIIAQELYPITPQDTHASVLKKTLDIFPRLLVEVLEDITAEQVTVTEQDPLGGCYFTRRYPRDSKIAWREMTDVQVHNLIRGMHGPYPAAFTLRGEKKVEIEESQLLEENIRGIPGRVPMFREGAAVVLAKNRGLLINQLVVEGKKTAPADFLKIGDDLV